MRPTRRVTSLIAMLFAAGCGHASVSGPVVCTALAAPALTVSLVDSLTGATTGFTDVSFIAVSGAYRDSVFQAAYPSDPFAGGVSMAYEHRGTFELTVLADGYIPWVRSGIVVTGDVCHVTPVAVTARLVHPVVEGELR